VTKHSRHFELFLLLAVSAVVWRRPLATDVRLALSVDAHNYILLIVPISIAMIYVGRTDSSAAPQTGRSWGIILLGIALVFRLLAAWNIWRLSPSDNLSFSIGALVLFWMGSAIICFGPGIFKANLFPLCFLFLIIPLPDHALLWVTEFLQQTSAWAAALLFRMVGVPVTRDGIMLSIPGLDIEVATECSSIRSSTMLIVVTLILAHLFLRTWSRKTLLVLTAIPLSFLKNAVRIFTIAELGTRVNPDFLDGRLHHEGGIIFFGLAVLATVVLLLALRRSETQTTLESSPALVSTLRR